MTTLAQFVKSEGRDIRKKFDFLTQEQAEAIARHTMNRYVNRPSVHDLIMSTPAEPMTAVSSYGHCPKCGEPGVKREKRPNGNDTCKKGHKYPTKDAVH